MGEYLAEELKINILLRLPVVCLVRFRCVCKAWYVLLSDPNFIYKSLVFNSDNAPKDPYLLFNRADCTTKDWIFSLLPYDTLDKSMSTFNFPHPINDYRYRILGSFNGLICLEDVKTVLWNPSTSQIKILPHPVIPLYKRSSIFSSFCFDANSDDYKVVSIFEIQYGYCGDPLPPYIVCLYSLKSDSWKRIDFNVFSFKNNSWSGDHGFTKSILGIGIPQMHRNGACFWEVVEDCVDPIILSFDPILELFKKTSLPDESILGIMSYETFYGRILWFNDNMGMIHFNPHQEIEKYSIDVLVLYQIGVSESWTKLYSTAPILPMETQNPFSDMFLLWKNGKLLLESCAGEVMVIDLANEEISHLQIKGEPLTVELVNYIESQVRLD